MTSAAAAPSPTRARGSVNKRHRTVFGYPVCRRPYLRVARESRSPRYVGHVRWIRQAHTGKPNLSIPRRARGLRGSSFFPLGIS